MGVPSFFRWLARKYPKIQTDAVTDDVVQDGKLLKRVPAEGDTPNPNGFEVDHLYLDMNGIIHPCCHPEDKPPPPNEDAMYEAIFHYIDGVMELARPRKLLYMAVDGVAPRAKINQQRSRRFKSSLERDILQIQKGNNGNGKFDSNCITPGTPFMGRLSEALRYYVALRQSSHPLWKNICVILSDAFVPGEGEHKIMDYIRRQRLCESYNANLIHVMYGLDADLIMLGLSLHEPGFKLLRENVRVKDIRTRRKRRYHDETESEGAEMPRDPSYIGDHEWLHIDILRGYLIEEMNLSGLPFQFCPERVIDDYVFLCFFVGNDFLPQMLAVDIRKGGVDLLVEVYKNRLPTLGGYLTENGNLNLDRTKILMHDIAILESEILKRSGPQALVVTDSETLRKPKMSLPSPRKVQENPLEPTPKKARFDDYDPLQFAVPVGRNASIQDYQESNRQLVGRFRRRQENQTVAKRERERLRARVRNPSKSSETQKEALAAEQMNGEEHPREPLETAGASPQSTPIAESALECDRGARGQSQTPGTRPFRKWDSESAFLEYYAIKYHIELEQAKKLRVEVVKSYVEGLHWVLSYYYKGCQSWSWSYPHHYAPFARDFECLPDDFQVELEMGEPLMPFEQLMSCLPSASAEHLPEAYRPLMTDPSSTIADFYPKDFRIDMSGKRFLWQGTILLPKVDLGRLREAMNSVCKDLKASERALNVVRSHLLFVGKHNPYFDELCKATKGTKRRIQGCGIEGFFEADEDGCPPGASYQCPIPAPSQSEVIKNESVSVCFYDPEFPQEAFTSKILPDAKTDNLLSTGDVCWVQRGSGRDSYTVHPLFVPGVVSDILRTGNRELTELLRALVMHRRYRTGLPDREGKYTVSGQLEREEHGFYRERNLESVADFDRRYGAREGRPRTGYRDGADRSRRGPTDTSRPSRQDGGQGSWSRPDTGQPKRRRNRGTNRRVRAPREDKPQRYWNLSLAGNRNREREDEGRPAYTYSQDPQSVSPQELYANGVAGNRSMGGQANSSHGAMGIPMVPATNTGVTIPVPGNLAASLPVQGSVPVAVGSGDPQAADSGILAQLQATLAALRQSKQ